MPEGSSARGFPRRHESRCAVPPVEVVTTRDRAYHISNAEIGRGSEPAPFGSSVDPKARVAPRLESSLFLSLRSDARECFIWLALRVVGALGRSTVEGLGQEPNSRRALGGWRPEEGQREEVFVEVLNGRLIGCAKPWKFAVVKAEEPPCSSL